MRFRVKEALTNLLSLTNSIDFFWRRLPNGVYVFNYHRIGKTIDCKFDHAIFSCSTEAFDNHIKILKESFQIINTIELTRLIEQKQIMNNRYALITFDDGYEDNYTNAFPILKKHNVPAIFYVATDFVDSNHIPWWDEIAFLIRQSAGQEYQLIGTNQVYNLAPENINQTIQRIMSAAKQLTTHTIDEVLQDVRMQCFKAHESLHNNQVKLFMTWKQVKQLADQGMEIGSHTISHRILSQLDKQEQSKEIIESKLIIEQQIEKNVNSIAYPVGRYFCYNQASFELSIQAGYQIAFNNEPGRHQDISNPYDINRFCVAHSNFNRVKFECCFTS
ncbi:polysaccharide deacetylase family protein [Thalassotalea castellviae]|uniref:Polysaccharide deacetylase family protein n=1 Tax=Thalassotalea castellviae TaxID=3075612 RepID=A0ABU3A491_9GAMM|nr:polysaccharide deacetylase family protein [Thalassotalea sp. W431]MDT0603811.1 polysaccharide deacetylase family protein [Thalassotalea sp. W431]